MNHSEHEGNAYKGSSQHYPTGGRIAQAQSLHDSTFEYLRPSEDQLQRMETARTAAKVYADVLDSTLPPGPDKTFVLRKLRDVQMWANVAITRNSDGSPRTD